MNIVHRNKIKKIPLFKKCCKSRRVIKILFRWLVFDLAAKICQVAEPVSDIILVLIFYKLYLPVVYSVADPGCLSRIPDPDFLPIPDPGSKKQQQKRGVKKNLLS